MNDREKEIAKEFFQGFKDKLAARFAMGVSFEETMCDLAEEIKILEEIESLQERNDQDKPLRG